MLQTGYTYALGDDSTVSVYADPGIEVPTSFKIRRLGVVEEAHRVSDRDLECGWAAGVDAKGSKGCTSHECHRRVLGKCQCGRHKGAVPFRKAAAS